MARSTRSSIATANSLYGVVRGEILASPKQYWPQKDTVYQFRSRDVGRDQIHYDDGFLGFFYRNRSKAKNVFIQYRFPLWPVVVILALAAFFVRPKPRLKYGLKDLMLFLTLFALTFGAIVSFVNSYGLYGF